MLFSGKDMVRLLVPLIVEQLLAVLVMAYRKSIENLFSNMKTIELIPNLLLLLKITQMIAEI